MKTAVIVCDGQFPRTEYPLYLLRNADLVLCCDGALGALEKRSIVPDVVIGDMDSVCSRALKRFPDKVVKIDDQQTNDLTKAFSWLMDNCPADLARIHILGATGRREDHTLGNLALLMDYQTRYRLDARGIGLDMVSDYSTALAIGDSTTLDVGEGRGVSLFSPDPTLSIHSEGLRWATDAVVFTNWWQATLNTATTDRIRLTLSHPAPVLIILS